MELCEFLEALKNAVAVWMGDGCDEQREKEDRRKMLHV